MFRTFSALLAAAVFALPVSAQGKQLTIRWHGQAFFDIQTSAGTRIAIDPHAIEAFGERPHVKADLICITHLHNDHTQVEIIENFDPRKLDKMVRLGITPGKGGDRKKEDWNILDEKFKDVHIQTVATYHDNVSGMSRGKNGVWVIDVAGLRIVHLGDLGHSLSGAQLKKLGKVDVLMIPVGGVYTINGSEAKQVIEQLKPRYYILPMHYGIKGYDALLGPDEFLEDPKLEILRPRKNELVIDVGAKPPEAPKIVMLGWESK
jgi:L-ascorbate metabolism protein UlaG (beta-lactamase superfamily)